MEFSPSIRLEELVRSVHWLTARNLVKAPESPKRRAGLSTRSFTGATDRSLEQFSFAINPASAIWMDRLSGSGPRFPTRKFSPTVSSQNTLLGSTYVRPLGEPVLVVPTGEQNVLVNLGEGDLESELQKPATLEVNNRVVIPDSNTERLRVTVSASSGALRGSFIHPVTGRPTRHSGVVFQKQNLAEGYFLGTEQAGFVSVVPTDGQNVPPAVEPPVVDETPVPDSPVPTEPIPQPKRKRKN